MLRLEIVDRGREGDIRRWALGEAKGRVIKENEARTVWRVPLGQPALYVKRFPAEVLRNRARKEARLLQELSSAGIACPKLLATAQDRRGTYVITEEIAGAEILRSLLSKGRGDLRRALVRLGWLLRRLHDGGFHHLDFHVGNVLMRGDELFVLDVHRAVRRKRLSQADRRDGLAFAILSFYTFVPRTEVLRFLQGYGLRSAAEFRGVESRFRLLRDRYYRSRQKRCMEEGTEFTKSGGMWHRREISLEEIRRVLSLPRVTMKELPGRRLFRIGTYFFKEGSVRSSLRSWKNAHALSVRDIPVPRCIACGTGWVLGDWVEGVPLWDYIRSRWPRWPRSRRNDFLFRLARLVRRMHERGVLHKDLKANNVLVSDESFHVIDLDRVGFSREVGTAGRRHNLAQLNAAVGDPLTRTDRVRFLQFYFGHDRSRWREKREWIGSVMKESVARRHVWPPR